MDFTVGSSNYTVNVPPPSPECVHAHWIAVVDRMGAFTGFLLCARCSKVLPVDENPL